MLPLDGVPQFTLLLLAMGFSAYVAQFIHRLDVVIRAAVEQKEKDTEVKARAYRNWLRATLTVLIVDNFAILFRIGLRMFDIGYLAFDLSIVSLIFLVNILLSFISFMSYRR